VPDAVEEQRIAAALASCGLIKPGETLQLTALAGGVSCDVYRAQTRDGRVFAVKQALPKLRVAAEWLASPERSESEVRWLGLARSVDPRLAPEVVAEAPAEHLFVMRYLEPATHPVWKSEMAEGRVDPAFAGQVGRDLARIHAATANRPDIAADFQTDALFMALRIDPFLLYVAGRDASVAARLRKLAQGLQTRKAALAHGDVSPKNILMGPDGPVFLDAECAVYGDPAFDLAFCLTHLLLKTVWLKDHAKPLLTSFDNLWSAYRRGIDWEPAAEMSNRAAALIAGLLLARVDGKSPAPYLEDEADKTFVRRRAHELLAERSLDLDALARSWRAGLPPA
jgi:aminoglycoside phosphotransferase (APT) family kinase protein